MPAAASADGGINKARVEGRRSAAAAGLFMPVHARKGFMYVGRRIVFLFGLKETALIESSVEENRWLTPIRCREKRLSRSLRLEARFL
jgi:hypothetical protein